MGARLAVRTGGRFPGTVAAAGGFHGGRLVTEDPDSPHLAIASSTAEHAFGHADRDRLMPLEQIEALEEALRQTGRRYLNEVYEGAPHGYAMADTPMYDEAAAERHFAVPRGCLRAPCDPMPTRHMRGRRAGYPVGMPQQQWSKKRERQ